MTSPLASTLLDRFCRYVRVDTTANDSAKTYPSSAGQIELGRLLTAELREMGARDVEHTEHGVVYATVPAAQKVAAPNIAWIAHLDTSPESSGANVVPIVHRNYDGGDLVLPGEPSKVLRPAEYPELRDCIGRTIITTDGTTLLGADDKAGVAVIMETTRRLLADPSIPHGPIRVCFTCDEEIGHGVDHVDLTKLAAVAGYTLDGNGVGEINAETFSAQLATVTVTGANIHPGIAKGKMVNALRIAGAFLDRLPRATLAPESTDERQGFLHPYGIEGGVAQATMKILLRDFETARLADHARVLHAIAEVLLREHPTAKIDIRITDQYRNMAEGMAKEPRAVPMAEEAMRRTGVTPRHAVIRGGTDGSRLTEIGLPTPNLSVGEHNIHSPLEWTCLEEMELAVDTLIELAKVWGEA